MKIKLLSEPHIEYSSESYVPDHCTFHFENEEGAIGMVIIGGWFGNDHPMPKAKGDVATINGHWQDHHTFVIDLDETNLPECNPAHSVMVEAQKAATALMRLRNEDDDEIRGIAESVLRMANYANPSEYAILREIPETWLRQMEDEWLYQPVRRPMTVAVGDF